MRINYYHLGKEEGFSSTPDAIGPLRHVGLQESRWLGARNHSEADKRESSLPEGLLRLGKGAPWWNGIPNRS
jgi:hypothetical protein